MIPRRPVSRLGTAARSRDHRRAGKQGACPAMPSNESPQDAEDLRQETYVRLLKVKQLDPLECRARAYMFKIATNLVRDRFRRAAVRGQQLPADDCDLVSDDPQPDRIADWNQGMQIIKQTLLDLKPRTRQVFLLHVTEHLSYREIAKRLGVNKKTVERDMRLTLELCQDRLKVWQRT